MRPDALERDKCPCFGYSYPFAGLGKLLSNPKGIANLFGMAPLDKHPE